MRRTEPSLFRSFQSVSPRVLLAAGGLLAAFVTSAASAHGGHGGHGAPGAHPASGMPGAQAAPASDARSIPASPQSSGAPSRPQEPALDNSGNYRQEVRACHEGRTAQDLPTCLREARNAEADRKRGRLGNTGDFQANALARCSAFNEAQDKEACRARIVGHVEIQGSVAGGGILRQVAITVPSPQQPASSAMGANPAPATAAPMDDIDDEALPEEQDPGPGLDPGETLEEQPAAPEPGQ